MLGKVENTLISIRKSCTHRFVFGGDERVGCRIEHAGSLETMSRMWPASRRSRTLDRGD